MASSSHGRLTWEDYDNRLVHSLTKFDERNKGHVLEEFGEDEDAGSILDSLGMDPHDLVPHNDMVRTLYPSREAYGLDNMPALPTLEERLQRYRRYRSKKDIRDPEKCSVAAVAQPTRANEGNLGRRGKGRGRPLDATLPCHSPLPTLSSTSTDVACSQASSSVSRGRGAQKARRKAILREYESRPGATTTREGSRDVSETTLTEETEETQSSSRFCDSLVSTGKHIWTFP